MKVKIFNNSILILSGVICLILFNSCRPCFMVHCDECTTDQYSHKALLEFNASDYTQEELDTFKVYYIKLSTHDTTLNYIKGNPESFNLFTIRMLTGVSPHEIDDYLFKVQLKDNSQTFSIHGIYLEFYEDDSDGCCSCDWISFDSAHIDGSYYASFSLPLLINK